jgi:hypothetical protein
MRSNTRIEGFPSDHSPSVNTNPTPAANAHIVSWDRPRQSIPSIYYQILQVHIRFAHHLFLACVGFALSETTNYGQTHWRRDWEPLVADWKPVVVGLLMH